MPRANQLTSRSLCVNSETKLKAKLLMIERSIRALNNSHAKAELREWLRA
jgi:hypothetical protein